VSPLAILLVLVATVSHASWNYLTKRSRHRLAFLWWTGVAGSVLFLPAVLWVAPPWTLAAGDWPGVAGGAAVRAAYFAALGAAYARGDLSLVYPLARGIAPLMVPPLAVLVLGERPSPVGWAGIATIGLGLYVLHLPGFGGATLGAPFRALRSPHAPWAILTGGLTTTYSLVDAWNIRHGVAPLLYAYLTIPVAALLLTPVVARQSAALIEEGRTRGRSILAVGALMTGGYLLVLRALGLAPVSYVAPARELSIVIGTGLGLVALREPDPATRLAGAGLIVLGVCLLALAGP
jgi:drug/metabolite transporter (DMT)-like permease